jgi:hypothetical protein
MKDIKGDSTYRKRVPTNLYVNMWGVKRKKECFLLLNLLIIKWNSDAHFNRQMKSPFTHLQIFDL